MNAYFQLIGEEGQTKLRLVPPTNGGKELQVSTVVDYLSFHKITFELPALNDAVRNYEQETVIKLNDEELIPVNEELVITVSDDRMLVTGCFSCASDKGQPMTREEILSDLKYKGIKFGIIEDNIDKYLADKNYHESIVLAAGQKPDQGSDASIEYFFNTDVQARPTLNDDGSVDFFHLNIINHVSEGQLLARLTREISGTAGTDVMGGNIPPKSVAHKTLKFGRSIKLSDDKNEIYSMCNGHVSLVNDRVFVSDVMEVENVDNSTGSIEYEGNVQINGNVCSNFTVKAKGNVEVRGVVEGATIIAGGNITIARGMNGMGKGVLICGGNVVAKFIENSHIEADGYVESESFMHSEVVAGTEIHATGKKAFISGGKVTATSKVETRFLGSDMGADTVVEVGVSAVIKKQYKEIGDRIAEIDKALSRAIPIMEAARDKAQNGQTLNEEQLENVKNIYLLSKVKAQEREQLVSERTELGQIMAVDKNAQIIVRDTVYPGTKLVISDSTRIIKDSFIRCRFIRERGDVKLLGID